MLLLSAAVLHGIARHCTKCRYREDVNSPVPVIAQRLYNDDVRRPAGSNLKMWLGFQGPSTGLKLFQHESRLCFCSELQKP